MPQLDMTAFVNQYMWMMLFIIINVIFFATVVLDSIKKLIEISHNVVDKKDFYSSNKNYMGFKKLMSY